MTRSSPVADGVRNPPFYSLLLKGNYSMYSRVAAP